MKTFYPFRLLFLLMLCCKSPSAWGLGEQLDPFTPVQGLAMGGTMAAHAQGYLAHYFNPAGLAKMPSKTAEVLIADIQGVLSGSALGSVLSNQTFGSHRLMGNLQSDPGNYQYMRYSALMGFTMRGWGATVLVSHRYAGISDGTSMNVDSVTDIEPRVGFAKAFAGNLLKVGVSAKALLRDELQGEFLHSDLANTTIREGLTQSGLGFGFDLGIMMTLPNKYLPTLGIVYKDAFGTQIKSSGLLFGHASGNLGSINDSVNIAFSLQPFLTRMTRMTFSAEMKDLLGTEKPLRKKLHIGCELEYKRRFFFWAGMNQFYPTAGFGLRLPGGALELGTYAQDIGSGTETESSRRVFFRYTIGFEPGRRGK